MFNHTPQSSSTWYIEYINLLVLKILIPFVEKYVERVRTLLEEQLTQS